MKIVSFYSGEQIALSDLIYASADTPRQAQADITAGLFTRGGPRIVRGFDTTVSGTTVTVGPGSAILSYRKPDGIQQGLYVSEDAAAQTFECKSLAPGTYGVWVTFASQPTDLADRTSYASGGIGFNQDTEVYTRQAAAFGLKVSQAKPGDEYVQVATVSLPDGAATDTRPLLFEGSAANGFAPAWGSDADRTQARGLSPICDLETMIAALKVAIEDVKGVAWYERVEPGTSGGSSGGSTTGTGYDPALGQYVFKGPSGDVFATLSAQGITLGEGGVTFPDGTTMSTAVLGAALDDITANSVILRPSANDGQPSQLVMQNSAGNNTFSVDPVGNAQVAGTLNVGGLSTLNTLNAGNINVATLVTSADSRLGGKLNVTGTTTLAEALAQDLTVTATLSAGTALVTNLSTQTMTSQGRVTAGGLTVTGSATLPSTTADSLSVTGPLTVKGSTTLADAQAANVSVLTLAATGALTGGSLDVSGAIQGQSLALTLPADNALPTPLQVLGSDGTELLGLTEGGDLSVHGTLRVAGAQTNDATNAGALTATSFIDSGNAQIQGTLQVTGATTLGNATLGDVTTQALTATQATLNGPLAVTGATTLGALMAGASTVSSLTDTGNAQVQGSLTVGGTTTLGSVQTGSITATGLTTSGGVELAGLTVDGGTRLHATTTDGLTVEGDLGVSGNATVGGTLTASGTAWLPALTITAQNPSAQTTPLFVGDGAGGTLLSLDGAGDLVIKGGITVNGSQADGVTTLGALTATSINDTGNATLDGDVTIGGTLSVAGTSTLADTTTGDLSAASVTCNGALNASGAATLSSGLTVSGNTTTSSLSAHAVSVTNPDNGPGQLSVSGLTFLGETHTGALYPSSIEATGGLTLGGGLTVAGTTSLAGLTASSGATLANVWMQALSASSATVAGNQAVGGTLTVSGATEVPALSVALPASGASATPLVVTDSQGNALLTLDGSGDLSIAGTLTLTGNQTGQANNLGAITVTSFSDLGNALIQGSLQVKGATTLAGLTAGATTLGDTSTGALSPASLAVLGDGTVGGALWVTGQTTLGATSTGALIAASLSVTGNQAVGGTLGVSGNTTLGTASTGALTAASLSVTANQTVGGTLGVTGATTVASTLGVSGGATFGSTLSVSGTATVGAVTVALPATGGASTPVAVNNSDGLSLLSLDASGNLTIAGTFNAAGGATASAYPTFTDGSGPPSDPSPVAGSAYFDQDSGSLYFAS